MISLAQQKPQERTKGNKRTKQWPPLRYDEPDEHDERAREEGDGGEVAEGEDGGFGGGVPFFGRADVQDYFGVGVGLDKLVGEGGGGEVGDGLAVAEEGVPLVACDGLCDGGRAAKVKGKEEVVGGNERRRRKVELSVSV